MRKLTKFSTALKGRMVHRPFWIMDTNSSARKAECSRQERWGPLAMACHIRSGLQGGVVTFAATP
jgi:hypothetical protein